MADAHAYEHDVFSSIPRLLVDGTNWTVYKMRLEIVIQSLGYDRHFTGETSCPAIPCLTAAGGNAAEVLKAVEAERLWKACEARARHALASHLPDITLCKVYRKERTVAEMWSAVCAEYEAKAARAQSEMRAELQSMRCEEDDDLSAHLDLMCKKRDDLALAGGDFTDEEFTLWIMRSLPGYYSNHILKLVYVAELLERKFELQSPSTPSSAPFNSDKVMHFLKREFDVHSRENNLSAKSKDVPLAATGALPGAADRGNPNSNGRRPPKSSRQPRADQPKPSGAAKGKLNVCWYCGGANYHRCQCPGQL
jgi:hypothetical protein